MLALQGDSKRDAVSGLATRIADLRAQVANGYAETFLAAIDFGTTASAGATFSRPPDAYAVVERLLPLVANLQPLPDIVEPSAGLTPAQLYSLLQPALPS
jgi:hypothetical protein